MSLSVAQVLKGGANAFMAALLAKRVADDVVKSVPYLSAGVGAVLGLACGAVIGRAQAKRRGRPVGKSRQH